MREDVQIEEPTDEAIPTPPAARTGIVLTLLVLAAGLFSYLAGYAVVGALLAAELISPWPPDRDPRPRFVVISFLILMLVLSVLAFAIRYSSRRELRHIDEIGTD